MEHSFGALLQEPDPRDYPLDKLGGATPTPFIPPSFRPDYSKIEVRHQHKQPACGSHAGATLEGILSSIKGESTLNNSPRFLWKDIKDIDGYPIEVGTDLYSIFNALRTKGVCDITLVPSDDEADTLSLAEYRALAVTLEMTLSAEERKITSYATIYAPTFEQVKKAIYETGAIIIQYRCGQNMYVPSWKAKDILPLSPDKFPMDSGHFVVGIGYDEQYIYFRNSWGETWGMNGDGYFGQDYLKYVYAIGTAVDKEKMDFSHTFTRPIVFGERSTEVTALQRVLKGLGHFLDAPTGYFGPVTAKAVYDFQVKHHVAPLDELNALKGRRVGAKTILKLNEVQFG